MLLLGGGLVLVVLGAEWFFKALLSLSGRLRMAPFVLTALVSGFELENLAAGIAANAKGFPDAAAGTFLGGTTFLAFGVTGLAAVISPLRADVPPVSILWAAASPVALVAVAVDGEVSRLDGALLVLWFAAVMFAITRTGRHLLVENPEREPGKKYPLLRLLGGLALLSVGGEILGEGIRTAIARFGVSQTLLGNTIVAASVEAEELGRVAVPAKRGRADVAIGNIVGTLVHFIAFNAGVIALVRPLHLERESLYLHLPVAVASVLTMTLLIVGRKGIGRLAGAVLLVFYVGYLVAAVAVAVA
ncbi:MAG: hypothetical protein M3O70_27225 [Actinomycetota bacterium]|nr:hypothetical protein [Actinomycetota bacterium]